MESDRQVIRGLYMHNKSNDVYYVMHVALDCTNERDGLRVVVYERYLHHQDAPMLTFVREEQEFLAKFTLRSK